MTIIGLAAAYAIPPVSAARAEGGIKSTIVSAWEAVQSDRVLRFGIIGAIAFWTIASLVGQDIIIYGKSVLGLSDSKTGLPLAAFGVGMGLGAVLAGKLSGAKVEYGLIPLGAVGAQSLFARSRTCPTAALWDTSLDVLFRRGKWICRRSDQCSDPVACS